MRYRLSLDTIEFLDPGLSAPQTRVEWSLGVWHPLLASDTDEIRPGEVAELASGEVIAPVARGAAGLNTETIAFLEWGGKIRMAGKVDIRGIALGIEDLGDFVIDVNVDERTGLFFGTDAQTVTGEFTTPQRKFRIHYRLQQLPFARAYDWVRVTINSLLLTPEIISELNPGLLVYFEAFVNNLTQPFRSGFAGTLGALWDGGLGAVHPEVGETFFAVGDAPWSYDVIYPRDDIGATLAIQVTLIFHEAGIGPDLVPGPEVRRVTVSREIPRFWDADRRAIAADDLPTAADNGAVAEWGIPAGLSGSGLRMTSEDGRLRIDVTLRNQRFDPAPVPAGFKAKVFDIEFPSVLVNDDTDPGTSGIGELKFACRVRLTADGETTPFDVGTTSVIEVEAPEDVSLPGPPRLPGLRARPGDRLELTVSAKDYDWPPLDPHDPLGDANEWISVPADDALDHRVNGLRLLSNNSRFEPRVRIITASPPPVPRLRFQGFAEDLTVLEVSPGDAVTLAFQDLVWATSGSLQRSVDDGVTWDEDTGFDGAPPESGELTSTPPADGTQYRLEVSNIAGSSHSDILYVRFVNPE
jgi:hypothetical protein